MFINKKMVSSMVLATVVTAGVQFTTMPAAEAGFLDGALGGIVKKVAGLDEEGIYKTYREMVDNYYAAAYYSNRAAFRGAELLEKYGATVEKSEAQLLNVSGDNSASAIDSSTRNMSMVSVKTDIKNFDKFADKIDKDDPVLKGFLYNREFQKKSLDNANKALATLIAKQALVGNAAEGVVQCINTAIQYQKIRDALAKEGPTMSELGKVISKKFKNVKPSKDEVKNAIANVPKG